MPSCEKCWSDAYLESISSGKSQYKCYDELIQLRKNNPCTPEQQAGKDAKLCKVCKRKTIHQYANVCMNNQCENYLKEN